MSSTFSPDGSFSLRIDRARSLVTMEVTGLWDHATVDRWEAELVKFLPRERAGNPNLHLLVDSRNRGIHSKEVAARVQTRAAWVATHVVRVAVVVSESALLTLQSRRIASVVFDDRQRFFAASEMAAAEAWLTESIAPRPDQPA